VSRAIDVHHHFLPDDYRAALIRAGHDRPDGMPAIPLWSETQALEFLEQQGIATAFLSISSPGVRLDETSAASALARLANETAAALGASHPGRFGSFAALPMPDTDACLTEIAYAFDVLKADGVTLLTNYANVYLGDPAHDTIFDELNRRKAIVFVHPTSPGCCSHVGLGFPRPLLEFMFETTRTVTNLIYSGTLDRCPDIEWIIPHAGATLPVLASRMDMARLMAPDQCHSTQSVAEYLKRFHYDLAGPRTDAALRALLGITDPSRLLYGSDWPFTSQGGVGMMREAILQTAVFDANQLEQIWSGNARRLFARLGNA
jgi:6-methylsalicylate decarboxylase